MGQTKIEWCDKVWNPITGCTPISEGCQNCYARRMANRLKGRYGYPKDDPFKVTFHPERLDKPLRWKKPSRIFVCSMGDLFHEKVNGFWTDLIIERIKDCPQHIFMILTKRPSRMAYLLQYWKIENFKNLFLGVSVENQQTANERIPILLQISAAKRIVSVEPMLGPVDFNAMPTGQILGPCDLCNDQDPNCPGCNGQKSLDWVICGGETGPRARPMHPDWVRSLKDQCQVSGVPFFFKSWGSCPYPPDTEISEWISAGYDPYSKSKDNCFLDGREWREFPK